MIILLTTKGNFATLYAMTRQWRIEFEGAYYHILSRGNERRNIFHDNDDRISFLKYLSEKPDVEIPQKRRVLRDTDPKTILENAAKVLKCNTNDFLQSSRISDSNKLNRDLLIYFLWSTGWYNNQEIGNLFGLGYSSISRRVTIMKSKISKEDEMNKRLENIKSLIKV